MTKYSRSDLHRILQSGMRLIRVGRTPRQRWVILTGMLLGTAVYSFCGVQAFAYANETVTLQHNNIQRYDAPIRIDFSRPVLGSVTYRIQEKIPGTWKQSKNMWLISALEFVPKKPLQPGSRLHITVEDVRPAVDLLSNTANKQQVVVQVESAPAVVSVAPKQDQQSVQIDQQLQLRLAAPNRGLRDLKITGNLPLVSDKPLSDDDQTFVWKLSRPLVQGTWYDATVIDLRQSTVDMLARYHFQTVLEPQVTAPHSGYLLKGQELRLLFDQDMAQTDAVLSFDMLGKGAWASAKEYRFTPTALELGKTYQYGVKAGAQAVSGGKIMTEKMFSAQTPGQLRVTGMSPSGGRVALNSAIRMSFDQPVDHKAAENAFSIQPKVDGAFNWSGDTLIFTPSGLQYQTTYTVSFAAGVQPVQGLPSQAFTWSFTTIYQTTKLGVPYYFQIHSLSCEEASLRMALAYRGIAVSDDDVLTRVGYNPQPRDTATNTWQDPYKEFVGSVDGRIGVDGWGVYASPIAAAAKSFGRDAQAVMGGVSASQIAGAILDGNPVVLWGVSGSRAVEDSWNTASSGVVRAPNNEHVRLVYGVDGTRENPVGFYVHDPIRRTGSIYWTTAQLQANSVAGGGQAVIVY